MRSTLRSSPQSTPAFSLIEVLIGVLILALGLLGLAAVFPVVVRQQRTAADQTQGLIVARNAEAYLRGHTLTTTRSVPNASVPGGGLLAPSDPIPEQNRRGLDILRYQGVTATNPYSTWSFNAANPDRPGPWEIPTYSLVYTNPDRGNMLVAATNQTAGVQFAQRDRLWPAAYSSVDTRVDDNKYANEPRYIWDVATRRVDPGTPSNVGDDGIQFAVFVRRIDSSIRVSRRDLINDPNDPLRLSRPTRDLRLADVLTGDRLGLGGVVTLQRAEHRVAVAVTNNSNSPVPTLNGEGEYAMPMRMQIEAIDDPDGQGLSRFLLPSSATDIQRRLLREPGQKFVDNLGNIYTVVKATFDKNPPNTSNPPEVQPENERRSILVSPAASANAAALAASGDLQVVFTPQVPAAVHVFTMEPR
ncbi:MAG: hypothetical protein KGS45_11415 [Planctomycetes bacterium]|nr:hypothetical protein [Planctomycetota bacterium]